MYSTVLNVRFTRSLRAAPIAAAKLSVTASKRLVPSTAAQIVPGKRGSETCGIVRLNQRNQNRIKQPHQQPFAALSFPKPVFRHRNCLQSPEDPGARQIWVESNSAGVFRSEE